MQLNLYVHGVVKVNLSQRLVNRDSIMYLANCPFVHDDKGEYRSLQKTDKFQVLSKKRSCIVFK